MTAAKPGMTDARAEMVLREVLQLALTVRDEGPNAVTKQLGKLERAARGDLHAALVVAAALVDVDHPIDRWWQDTPPPRPRRVPPARPSRRLSVVVAAESAERDGCGSHTAFNRHKRNGETPDPACVLAEQQYQAARYRDRQRDQRRGGAA